ncbi:hypothetical protein [Paludisphaera rhizosphaerae]|uniref:hypothetical protein n=1 Tax=Paludisphaera rhizosphaerae TaxID=2711216 RepID=UPI0013ECC559|nr:hypothetical protein [Paludisphaera rhizosphaerae]
MATDDVFRIGDEPAAAAPRRRKRLGMGKRLAFGAILLLLTWLACEVLAGLMYSAATRQPFSWAGMQEERRERANRPESVGTSIVSDVHPYVGYVQNPSVPSGFVRASDGRQASASAYGYLDDKEPIQKREPGKVIVGVTGGSVACYFGLNGTKRLEEALKESPEYADKTFVFVNLALGGYKEPQQLATLAYLMALGAEFDLVVNIDGFNEVALYELENEPHQVFPAFPRSWYARVGGDDPFLGVIRTKLNEIEESRNALARWVSRPPWRWSILCNVFWKLRDRRLDWERYQIVMRHQDLQDKPGPYVATGPLRKFDDRGELYEYLASIWSNASLSIDALCRRNGARYFHFLQPNQYVADSKPMDAAEKRLSYKEEHPYRRGVEKGYPLLVRNGKALGDRGVAFTDLTGLFRDHPESLYVDDCCHFNQQGIEIMAGAIARAIIERPASEPRP